MRLAGLAVILLAMGGCGGGGKAMVPVDSKVKEWQPRAELEEMKAEEPAPAETPPPAPEPAPAPKK